MAKKKAAKKTTTTKKSTTTKKKSTTKKASGHTKKAKDAKKNKPAKSPAASKASSSSKKKSTKSTSKKKSSPKAAAKAFGIRTQHIDFLTYKVDQVRKFYSEMLELDTDVRDADGLNYLLVRTSTSSSFGFMPPHPDMRGEQPLPREPTLYFVVEDVDRAYAQLTAKGAAFLGPPTEMPWGHRVVATTDPEGRTVMLASQVPSKKE